jgi:hypothetical protein
MSETPKRTGKKIYKRPATVAELQSKSMETCLVEDTSSSEISNDRILPLENVMDYASVSDEVRYESNPGTPNANHAGTLSELNTPAAARTNFSELTQASLARAGKRPSTDSTVRHAHARRQLETPTGIYSSLATVGNSGAAADERNSIDIGSTPSSDKRSEGKRGHFDLKARQKAYDKREILKSLTVLSESFKARYSQSQKNICIIYTQFLN